MDINVLLSACNFRPQAHYRMAEPARAVAEADLGVQVLMRTGLDTRMVAAPGSDDIEVGWVDAQGADVVVLQLPKTRAMQQCQRLLQAQGVAVVVEVDDLLSAVSPGALGYDAIVRSGAARRTLECAREADLVTVTTPTMLPEYAPHGRGVVVPNAIPRQVAELPPAYERRADVVTIGWTGSAVARPYDLEVIGTGLRQAMDRTAGRSRFMIMGWADGAQQRLGISDRPSEIPWSEDLDGYAMQLGELFDVGIAPVREDRFNNCKSGLKVLEYAARGVYPVHSPHPEYDRLRLGQRARNARDWARHLTTAVQDADHRRQVAAANHARVMAGHLTEHTAERWAAAWRQARDNRTRAMRIGA